MSSINVFWHLLGGWAPAIFLAALMSAWSGWRWRGASGRGGLAQRWWRLFWPSALAGGLTLTLAWWFVGRDGRMMNYLAMILVMAAVHLFSLSRRSR